MSETKAKINLKEGTIELEGSESFVRAYLDEFKEHLTNHSPMTSDQSTPPKPKAPSKAKPKASSNEETGKAKAKKSTAKKVVAERFDIHGGEEIPPLSEFIDQKRPGTANGPIIAVIGYYITELLGEEYFSEGQVEYAYKMLKIKRPNNLHQIMLNEKNRKDFFEPNPDDQSHWALTRAGEIFVSDNLPVNNED